jgi:hypothetical protein
VDGYRDGRFGSSARGSIFIVRNSLSSGSVPAEGSPSLRSARSTEGDRMLPRVRKVEPLPERSVRLEFTDGMIREVDLVPLLRGPVFEEVRLDRSYFERVRVNEVTGTIEWPNGADLDPDVLYDEDLEPA